MGIVAVVLSVLASLIFVWLCFVIALLVTKPEASTVKETARIVPDAVRLVHRLAADSTQRRGVLIRLWLLLAYLASPIDLIPDFIPVLGYLDDLILVPLGVLLVLRLIPAPVMADCRQQARVAQGRPVNWLAAAVIVLVWLGLAALGIWWLVRLVRP